ncbi:MAG: hypothetical protein HY776_03100 [Actinobacteria bacterium]|nr:hypothetical protein [Actinomycetota bacterium]
MFLKLSDTDKNAEKIQIDLLRKASIAQRIHIVSSLSASTSNLSRRAILRANPHFSKQDVDIAFVDLHYGHDLAERLKKYLESKK